jgi:cobalt-zinc-cadmium efflux system membrane fusion protein
MRVESVPPTLGGGPLPMPAPRTGSNHMAMRLQRAVAGTLWTVVALGAWIACSPGAPAPHAGDSTATGTAGGAAASSRHASAYMLSEEQRARIHTDIVAPTTFQPAVAATGTVAFNGDRSTPVLSQISGPVARILVNTGTHVEPGTPLALVSSPDFAEAIATYQKAQSTLQNAARIATLDEQLFKNDAIARSDLDQARSDSASAYADREAAIQQMAALGVDSATVDAIRQGHPVPTVPGVIRAPIEGIVVEKLINPGEVIQGGQTQCFTIANLSTVWVMANVFESDLAAVTKGEVARITTDASPDTLVGHVDYVAALVDTATRATGVRVLVENRHEILKRDMYVRVAIQSSKARTGLLVPVASVLRDDQNLPFVFVAEPDGGYDRRQITLGQRVGDRYEVTSGLKGGEHVVSEGSLFLQFAESQ